MFEWSTFWQRHRRKWWIEHRPKLFGGLRQFPRDLMRSWPKKNTSGGSFGEVLYWPKIIIPLFLCWVVTDWLFPVNPLVSIPLAAVVWQLITFFVKKLRGR